MQSIQSIYDKFVCTESLMGKENSISNGHRNTVVQVKGGTPGSYALFALAPKDFDSARIFHMELINTSGSWRVFHPVLNVCVYTREIANLSSKKIKEQNKNKKTKPIPRNKTETSNW